MQFENGRRFCSFYKNVSFCHVLLFQYVFTSLTSYGALTAEIKLSETNCCLFAVLFLFYYSCKRFICHSSPKQSTDSRGNVSSVSN